MRYSVTNKMIDYEKLNNLDYNAFDHYKDFEESLEKNKIKKPIITVSYHYEDKKPFVNVTAEDENSGKKYIDSYALDNVNKEEFEEVMYDIWKQTMKELEPHPDDFTFL